MLATTCPHCGRPAPIHLGATAVDCPACRVVSPLDTSVQARLAAAASVLDQVDARRRQFGRRSRWLISHAGLRAGFVGCAALLLTVPFLGLAWLGWNLAMGQRGLEVKDLSFILPCGAPLLLMMMMSALTLAAVRRRARKLREACAAIPPSAPGRPAGCHVCGGPVSQAGTDPVARCGYCGADNVVTRQDMEAAQARRGYSLDAFEEHLRQQSVIAGAGMRRMLLTMVLFTAAAPMLGVCGGCCLSQWIQQIETEPNLEREYFWTAGPEGMRCIGHVDWREANRARLRTPDCEHIGNSHPSMVDNDALPEMFDVRALEGRYLVQPRSGRPMEGRVVGVSGELDGRNWVTLSVTGQHGPRERRVIPTSCLCERVE